MEQKRKCYEFLFTHPLGLFVATKKSHCFLFRNMLFRARSKPMKAIDFYVENNFCFCKFDIESLQINFFNPASFKKFYKNEIQ